jgi:hypothetical protein
VTDALQKELSQVIARKYSFLCKHKQNEKKRIYSWEWTTAVLTKAAQM